MKTLFKDERMLIQTSVAKGAIENGLELTTFDVTVFNWHPTRMDSVVKTVTYCVRKDGKVIKTFAAEPDLPSLFRGVHRIFREQGIMYVKKSFSFKNCIFSLGRDPYRVERYFTKEFLESLK